MSGVVIRLEPPQRGLRQITGMVCQVDEAPFPGISRSPGRLRRIPSTKGRAGDPTPIEHQGARLATWLCQDEAIKAVIERVRERRDPPSVPIRLHVQDDAAHALPWETLYIDAFLALDPLSPIARIPRGTTAEARDPVRPLALPLRITCVLSARGADALPQWTAIHSAVEAARKKGLAIRLTVISGDEPILAAARQAQKSDPDLHVEPVPGPDAPVPLLQLIRSTEPHLLHFFAHGDIDANKTQRILVATISDVDSDSGILDASEVGRMAAEVGTWCVTLAICRGADATAGGFTHAEAIVYRGVPAAIAMRSEIEEADANRFTTSWFPAALEVLGAVTLPPSPVTQRRPLQWADTLIRPRMELRDRNGANAGANGVWAVPVLYVLPGTFQIEVPATPPAGARDPAAVAPVRTVAHEMQAQERLSAQSELERLIATLPPDTPPELIALLRAQAHREEPR
ncbi:CHAT domain-containing protein [Microbacterium sp. B2969]|uniref:CHAT domain-containing protein n=1 Tax=Microbacterium alkaliflavum TaxID=3248839 RepID=A0ABW7Q8K9_9MICO